MIDEQDERIAKILGVKNLEDIEDERMDVTEEALEEYFKYLKENIEYPCRLKASQEFSWEEYYTFGPGNKKEYERLRKKQPSYKDKFDLLGFEEEPDLDEGILVNVKRISDKKRFTLPLEDLEATDEKSKNYQLIDDYSVWFVNYR